MSASDDWGVDARLDKVFEVSTGVRWMCSLINSWAARTEDLVRGSSPFLSAMGT